MSTMVHDAHDFGPETELTADLCVVGTGPGGATVATLAAEAGLKVVALEAGALVTPADSTQREEDMLPKLLWASGAQTTTDRGVRVLQGHGLGGSSLHNLNLCKRIPPEIFEHWRRLGHTLEALPDARWAALYDEVEALLEVSEVPETARNRHNTLLHAGARTLGWATGGLRHNRSGCIGSGFCALGCAYDAKNNALKVLWPRALRAGARVLTHTQAVRVDVRGGEVRGVHARVVERPGVPDAQGRVVRIRAPRVCVSASATGTPALLERSGVPDPSGVRGRTIRLHPAVLVAAEFPEPVNAWQGIPQTVEVTEWLRFDGDPDRRLWIVPGFGHPASAATMLPGYGQAHAAWMHRYAHLGAFMAMLHDETRGTVRPDGDLGVALDYTPDAADRAALTRGLDHLVELAFAAGATRALVPTHRAQVLEPGARTVAPFALGPDTMTLGAVHPMCGAPMDDDPRRGPVDSRGAHHAVRGLWVSDASLLPTSTGVPPQLSVYALGLHVGRALLEAQR
jgi:choline dehydrogenase-like flavoprotein